LLQFAYLTGSTTHYLECNADNDMPTYGATSGNSCQVKVDIAATDAGTTSNAEQPGMQHQL
jgi:hypothetical protein